MMRKHIICILIYMLDKDQNIDSLSHIPSNCNLYNNHRIYIHTQHINFNKIHNIKNQYFQLNIMCLFLNIIDITTLNQNIHILYNQVNMVNRVINHLNNIHHYKPNKKKSYKSYNQANILYIQNLCNNNDPNTIFHYINYLINYYQNMTNLHHYSHRHFHHYYFHHYCFHHY